MICSAVTSARSAASSPGSIKIRKQRSAKSSSRRRCASITVASPASTSMPRRRSKEHNSAAPGSEKLTEAKSGRIVHCWILWRRRDLSGSIQRPVLTPIGSPGQRSRMARIAAAWSSGASDSWPSALLGWICSAPAPVARTRSASRARSAGVKGSAGCSAGLRLPLRQAWISKWHPFISGLWSRAQRESRPRRRPAASSLSNAAHLRSCHF